MRNGFANANAEQRSPLWRRIYCLAVLKVVGVWLAIVPEELRTFLVRQISYLPVLRQQGNSIADIKTMRCVEDWSLICRQMTRWNYLAGLACTAARRHIG
jgi:hypothetical protein